MTNTFEYFNTFDPSTSNEKIVTINDSLIPSWVKAILSLVLT